MSRQGGRLELWQHTTSGTQTKPQRARSLATRSLAQLRVSFSLPDSGEGLNEVRVVVLDQLDEARHFGLPEAESEANKNK